MDEHTVATYQVRREAYVNEFGADPLDDVVKPRPDESIWLGDFKRADNETRMLMIGERLDVLWQMLDHVLEHTCGPEDE